MKKILTIAFMLFLTTSYGQRRSTGYSDENRKSTGICVMVGGVAFTTAAVLEGGYQYGTYVVSKPATPTSSQQVTYVVPPVYQQTPRNIMFCVGVGLTITGLFTMLSAR